MSFLIALKPALLLLAVAAGCVVARREAVADPAATERWEVGR